MQHKHGFTDPLPQKVGEELARSGFTTLHGHARFTGSSEFLVGRLGRHAG